MWQYLVKYILGMTNLMIDIHWTLYGGTARDELVSWFPNLSIYSISSLITGHKIIHVVAGTPSVLIDQDQVNIQSVSLLYF